MDFGDRIERQLLRVSRGAHELTQMIDSWSRSPYVDGKPKHLVNGLLRGSVDLQESLLMLCRLQETARRASGGEDLFEAARCRSFGKDYYSRRLQEPRLSASEASSSRVELKKVIRDRLLRQNSLQLSSDDGKTSPGKHWMLTGRRVNLSAQAKKAAPNLIAKLMGLEELPKGLGGGNPERRQRRPKTLDEIIETMRTNGALESKQSVSPRVRPEKMRETADTHENGGIPPIVIMKPHHFTAWKKEEENVSSHGCTIQKKLEETGAKSFEKGENEPTQKGKTAAAASKKQLNRAAVFKEGKRTEDVKKQAVQGKKQVERKTGKTIAGPTRIHSTAQTTPKKRQPTTTKASQMTRKGRTDETPVKLASFNSTSSAKGETSSTQKRIKKPIASAKNADSKAKGWKQKTSLSITHGTARNNSNPAADGLQKQAEKESPKTFMNGWTMKTPKLICEVMPKSNRAKRLLGAIAESLKKFQSKATKKPAPEVKYHLRHLLPSSASFHNLAHELFGIVLPKPTLCQAGFFEEHVLGTDELLLDCTEELARRKSREGKGSIHQMVQERTANRSAYDSFGHLVEDMSEGIKKLARYGEAEDDSAGEDGVDVILEKDLVGDEGVLNAVWGEGWDRRICGEEADETVANVEVQIFSGLVFEVAKDLFPLKKDE